MIQAEHPGKRVEVWFQDEARFGQHGTLTRKWARKGSRPPAVKQTQHDYLYVLGAACPATGQTVGLLSPSINTGVVNRFLREMSKEIDDEVHVVLIWDGAGYHRSSDLEIPENITPITLPPYSPELNPIQNLWHYLRSHHWSNRKYADYDALREAGCEAWRATCLDNDLIQSVCRVEYRVNEK